MNNPTDEDLWGGELNDNMDIIDSALHTIATSGSAGVPSGCVSAYAGASAPSGWQLCYGQAISRATYASLFSVVGTTYGVGDGSTTFNLPDLRGRVAAGKDNMGGSAASRLTSTTMTPDGNSLAAVGGAQTHALITAQLASHTHGGATSTDGGHTHTAVEGANSSNDPAPSYATMYTGGNTQVLSDGVGATTSGVGGSNYIGNTSTGGALAMRAGTTGSTHSHSFTTAAAGSGDPHNNVQPSIILNYIIKE